MKAKQHLEQSMQAEQIREALNTHWHASAAGDANAEHDIYDDDAICDCPQSGVIILTAFADRANTIEVSMYSGPRSHIYSIG